MSSIAATFRIARRDAWRHKARSTLIIAMVAIPVLGLTGADVLARTMQLDAKEHLTRQLGQADVAIVGAGGGRVDQTLADPYVGNDPRHRHEVRGGSPASLALQAQALSIVGAGPGADRTTYLDGGYRNVTANDLTVDADHVYLDLTSPLTHGLASVTSGAAPTTAQQVGITSHLAQRLGVAVGDSVEVDGTERTISGVVRNPAELNQDAVYGPALPASDRRRPTLLAATTRPVLWTDVQKLNALGFTVLSRSVVLHPTPNVPPPPPNPLDRNEVGIATVSVGLAVLEVVLLAGAAFAVGARRMRRDLAVVGAAGGDGRHAAQVVLAGGVVLGGVGAVVGLAGGIGAARLALGRVATLVNHSPGHFDLRPVELVAIVVIGILTGLVAAVLPARAAARDDVVAALTGRRGATSMARRWPIVGLAMIVLGAVLAARAASGYHFRMILFAAAVCELGFVFCAPTVVGFAGRLAGILPLAPRLALRDASRHRGRSGPAVAAVMAAIAGSVTVSTYFVSTVHRDRAEFTPEVRVGQAMISVSTGGAAPSTTEALTVARNDLGATSFVRVPRVACVQVGRSCLFLDSGFGGGLAVGNASLLRTLIGRPDPAAESALLAGKVLLLTRYDGPSNPLYRTKSLRSGDDVVVAPASAVFDVDPGPDGASVPGIVSPATAARLHLRWPSGSGASYLALLARVPSQQDEDRADAQFPTSAGAVVGRPYSPGGYSIGLVVLAITAGFVTLGATAISVGLSMAESKPDLVTLSAVGGRPLTRRLLVASQAGTVAVLGAVQGVVAGLVPAWAILHAIQGSVPFVLPWTTILIVVVGVPVLAMIGTAAFAGTRLTLDRRLT